MKFTSIGPETALPLPPGFPSAESYVESLLEFGTSSQLLQTLCGGVHILDFFTRPQDVYEAIFQPDWRNWFRSRNIMDVLDFLMREDLSSNHDLGQSRDSSENRNWPRGQLPPQSLVEYVHSVRRLCLTREFEGSDRNDLPKIARHVSVGMKAKKVHEVSHFADYISQLSLKVGRLRGQEITHLVDFGSGQNYLGRALSTEPYNKKIIAVESRPHNIEGSRDKDVLAGIVQKPKFMRNKKEYRAGPALSRSDERRARIEANNAPPVSESVVFSNSSDVAMTTCGEFQPEICASSAESAVSSVSNLQSQEHGHVTYVGERIHNGDLNPVLEKAFPNRRALMNDAEGLANVSIPQLNLMTLSIHSCGNLLHHGLRTILNPEVSAVALIGCCYNLMTERLGPPSFKLPGLQYRTGHPRLQETSSARDPHGFPMSQRFASYKSKEMEEPGVRFNISARMMAVQAPANWGRSDSDEFFTRHFFRALLQRVFVDYGVVPSSETGATGNSSGSTQPIIIGTLGKTCYSSFVAYVRGAVKKLTGPNTPSPDFSALVAEKLSPDALTDKAIARYERKYTPRKHDLAITWSLMAYSAGIVESMIIVDRWLWLQEQEEVAEAWVEPVFSFKESPRNLVIVGIKRPGAAP